MAIFSKLPKLFNKTWSFNFSNLNVNINVQGTTVLVVGGVFITCAYGIYKYYQRKRKVRHVSNKCVFITGCDSGFGNGLAKLLDEQGITVFAGCLTKEGAEMLSQETSGNLETCIIDITNAEDIESALAFVKQKVPPGKELWGVVNNAGIMGPSGPAESLDRNDFQDVMEVNFFGHVEVTKAFLPLLKRSHGRIVFTASMAAIVPDHMNIPYTVSKYALLGYADTIREDKFVWDIHVATILPGVYATPSVLVDSGKVVADVKQRIECSNAELKSQYDDDYFKRVEESWETTKSRANVDLTPVTNAMYHALFAKYPQESYVVGLDCKIMQLMRYLPFGHSITRRFSSRPSTLPLSS